MWLSAIDYVPAGGGNGKILDGKVLGSYDGENFFEIGEIKGWRNNETVKTLEITGLERPVSYVKIMGTTTSAAGRGSFMSGRMFNFYKNTLLAIPEDTEKPAEPEKPGDEGDKPDENDKTEVVAPGGVDNAGQQKPSDLPTVLPGGNNVGGTVVGGTVSTDTTGSDRTDVPPATNGGLQVGVDEKDVAAGVKVESGRLPLSSSLSERFGANSEYYDLSFTDADGKVVEELPEKVTIAISKDKKLIGVYLVKDDGTLEKVDFEQAGEGKITILSPNTGKYLFDYEDGRVSGESTVEKDEKEWYQNPLVWIGVALVVILAIGVGMSMAENRRR